MTKDIKNAVYQRWRPIYQKKAALSLERVIPEDYIKTLSEDMEVLLNDLSKENIKNFFTIDYRNSIIAELVEHELGIHSENVFTSKALFDEFNAAYSDFPKKSRYMQSVDSLNYIPNCAVYYHPKLGDSDIVLNFMYLMSDCDALYVNSQDVKMDPRLTFSVDKNICRL